MLLKRRVNVVITLDFNPAKESKQPCSSKNTAEKRGKQNIQPNFGLFLEFLSINFQIKGHFHDKQHFLPNSCPMK